MDGGGGGGRGEGGVIEGVDDAPLSAETGWGVDCCADCDGELTVALLNREGFSRFSSESLQSRVYSPFSQLIVPLALLNFARETMVHPGSIAPEDRKTLNVLPRSAATGSSEAAGVSAGEVMEEISIITARSGFQDEKKSVRGCMALI